MSTKKRRREESEDPSTLSSAYRHMAPKFIMADDLLGGTMAMREAGDRYLPRHSEESSENYRDRLERTTLFNAFELTLDSLTGKPFGKPVKLKDDVPEQVKELAGDVDLQGNDLTTFARNWFRESLAKAFSHVIVDMPALREEEREGRTREDDLRDSRRPYWVFVKPENVIFASAEVVNGREVLTHVRIWEESVERLGFAEVVKTRIRVLEPGRYELWELVKPDDGRRKAEWERVDEGETNIDIIPMVTFYADRTGLMTGKPPLEDLAFMNVRHWQSTADQMNVLTVARYPMLAVAGAADHSGTVMAIGPKQLLGTRDPNGRYYYVEHSGKAIEAGRQDLKDLEHNMAHYGAEFLKQRPGHSTATARALDSAEATSRLQDIAVRFQSALSSALDLTAKWLSVNGGEGGTAEVVTQFGGDGDKDTRLTALLTARYGDNRKPGDLSREAFLSELKEIGFLRDDFDPRLNFMQLVMEAANAGFDTDRIDPDDFRLPAGAPTDDDNDDDDEDDE